MEERLARVEEQLVEVLACLTQVEIRVGDLGQPVAYLEGYIGHRLDRAHLRS